MKLKTLKELKREWEYDAGLDAVVPFKDGEPIGCSNDIVIFDELKSEAVKWVKKLIEEDNYDKHGYYDNISLTDFKKTDSGKGLGISWAECSDIPAVINFIKHFFNLTEEELSK